MGIVNRDIKWRTHAPNFHASVVQEGFGVSLPGDSPYVGMHTYVCVFVLTCAHMGMFFLFFSFNSFNFLIVLLKYN